MSLERFVLRPYGNYPSVAPAMTGPGDSPSFTMEYEAPRKQKHIDVNTLTVGGPASFQGTVTVPSPVEENEASTKGYVLGALPKPGKGLTFSEVNNTLSVESEQRHIDSLGVLNDLEVSGNAIFHGTVTVPVPKTGEEACNKQYADSLRVSAGTGLVSQNGSLSVAPVQNQINKVGTLRSLMVSGPSTFASTVAVRDPVDTMEACNRGYVDRALKDLEEGIKRYIDDVIKSTT